MQEEIIEEGIVIKSEDGFVDVKIIENDNCEECSAKLFCKPKEDSTKILTIKDQIGLTKGEKVSIIISGNTLLKASFNLYLYPLLLLITSIFIGTKIFADSGNNELYSFLLGGSITVIYYLVFFLLGIISKGIEPKILISKTQ